ncbi:hypothetical protein EVAR_51423_1 [Eumeta japonica]|uniref:Uncharacterized protein n=1 Tax=Eumeta variegata TaxID=151549 RepID=A0A4C1XWA8_EUMVA|nr:hypothetical protein EVAR_51423_1 [Eumeta japonica]
MTYASPSSLTHSESTIDYRDLELPTISKYMKDASKRFFDIAGSHPNALLRAAVDYQPPHPLTLSVGHGTYLPIHLTLLQRRQVDDKLDGTLSFTECSRTAHASAAPVTCAMDDAQSRLGIVLQEIVTGRFLPSCPAGAVVAARA